MGRKKQNPEDSQKRAQILDAASKMFLTQGYSEVSMDALAEAVPVSKRTLYNHFRDKDALFTAVMQSRCQTVFQVLEEVLQEGLDVKQTLTAIGERFLAVVLEPEAINIYRTAMTQAHHFPEMGRLFYESGPKHTLEILSEYMGKLHKKGTIHAPNPKLAAAVFLGMLTNRIQMKLVLGIDKKVDVKLKKMIVDYVVRVFLQGVSR